MEKILVAPSLLAADFMNLEREVKRINDSKAEWLHLDVMDFNFVPNLTFGYNLVDNITDQLDKVADVHLMIEDPIRYVEQFANAGADYLCFHYEAVSDVQAMIDEVKKFDVKVGMAVKPNTEINVLDQYLDQLDLVLVMSVEPGFGGQKFNPVCLDKIKYLADAKQANGYNYLIEVDGGINDTTIDLVKQAGIEVVVAGSYVFCDQMEERIASLR